MQEKNSNRPLSVKVVLNIHVDSTILYMLRESYSYPNLNSYDKFCILNNLSGK